MPLSSWAVGASFAPMMVTVTLAIEVEPTVDRRDQERQLEQRVGVLLGDGRGGAQADLVDLRVGLTRGGAE